MIIGVENVPIFIKGRLLG